MRKGLLFAGLISLILVLVSCGNMLQPNEVGGGAVVTSAAKDSIVPGKKVVNATIVNYSSYVGSRSARAIQENTYAPGALKFYLEGKSLTASAEDHALAEITTFDAATGKFTIDLDPAVWVLTLYACKTGETLSNDDSLETYKLKYAVLMGTATVDLTRHNNTASFTLSHGHLTRPADVTITIKTQGSWFNDATAANYDVKAGIYELISGKVIMDGASTPASTEKAVTFTSGTSDPAYAVTKIKPGTYTFAVKFTGKTGTTCEDEEMVWSTKIIIEPGHDITYTVEIPNLIQDPPAAPSNFKAYYLKPDTEGWYGLSFSWKDESLTEKYFEIQLADLSNVASATDLATDDTEWNSAVNTKSAVSFKNYKSVKGIYSSTATPPAVTGDEFNTRDPSKYYLAGGLEKNNENFIIRVPTGTKYDARIRAVNTAGESEWVYVTRETSAPAAADLKTAMPDNAFVDGLTDDDAGIFNASSKLLNLYMMTYNLNGGAYTDDVNSVQVTANYVVFDSYERNYVTVTEETPATDPKTYNVKDPALPAGSQHLGQNLMNNGAYWSGWYTLVDATTESPINLTTTPKYTGTKDVEIFAAYRNTLTGTIDSFNRNAYELHTDWISCVNVTNSNAPVEWTDAADHRKDPISTPSVACKISGAASKLKWSITVDTPTTPVPDPNPIVSGFKYDKIVLEVKSTRGAVVGKEEKTDVAFGTETAFTSVDIGKCEGLYTAEFTAYYSGVVVGSKTYMFRVTN